MRKYGIGFGVLCFVAATMVGCSKGKEGCCGSCKDKAADVKMDAAAAPAGSTCAEKKACGSSCGSKSSCSSKSAN